MGQNAMSSEHTEMCDGPGCEFPAGHESEHPCGRPAPPDGSPCQYCGLPEPCSDCWRPITIADFKAICAEAGRSVELGGDHA